MVGRERVRTLGPILAEGEELLYADAALRDAALGAVRFDARDCEEVARGLSIGSLELTSAERMTLDTLRHTPQDRLAAMGAFRKMERARSASSRAPRGCASSAPGAPTPPPTWPWAAACSAHGSPSPAAVSPRSP